MRKTLLLLGLLAALPVQAQEPTVATLYLPGAAPFVRVARDVVDVQFSIDPSMASGAGLFQDADRVPSYAPANVDKRMRRLNADLLALRAMPWRSWPIDRQIDFRWIYAQGELAQRVLTVEHLQDHRMSQWLEPLANNLIALITYAPDRTDLRAEVWSKVPAMLSEVRQVCLHPTVRDVQAAHGIIKGLMAMCQTATTDPQLRSARSAASEALLAYDGELSALHGLPEFTVIGAENYAWRLKHALLMPWTPDELLARAESDLKVVDAEMAALKPSLEPAPTATPEQKQIARDLTRAKLLALYDRIPVEDMEAVALANVVTVPDGVGPIRARETPDAMVPLSGDGGSMNPPVPVGGDNVGWWNVEHFHTDWDQARREFAVVDALDEKETSMGPYAAHEGVPGHHLQLSIARLNLDKLRSILPDSAQNEGWGLYAEGMFYDLGGLGSSHRARYDTLSSYRARVRRVIYDVNIETGRWTLQQAADFKYGKAGATVDEDILRSINWPTQLIGYYAGRTQILAILGTAPGFLSAHPRPQDPDRLRKFHDAFLGVGSVPVSLARAKIEGQPVPEL